MINVIIALLLSQASTIQIRDEGVKNGSPFGQLNCSGSGVSCAGPSTTGGIATITVSGGGGGTDVTLGAFGAAPNANGLTINGAAQVLNMEPADSTHPGGVSLAAQNFAGIKTFDNQTNHSGIVLLSGSNSIQFTSSAHSMRYAANYLTGLQLIGDNIELDANSTGVTRINDDTIIALDKQLKLADTFTASVQSNVTADRTITLPDATGTIPVTPTCGVGEYATGNGTVLSCSTPAGAASPLTTKGDLFTYTTVDARKAVGADGLCLKANSAEATGLEWAACSAGGGISYAEAAAAVMGGF